MSRIAWLCLTFAVAPAAPASASIKATTGEPSFVESFSPTKDESDSARYGMLYFPKHSLTYVVEPRANGELRVVIDRNADGDLTNDPPVELTKGVGPWGKAIWTVVVSETRDANATRIKLVLRADTSLAYVYETHTREGSIGVGDRTIKFVLQGKRGVYDQPYRLGELIAAESPSN